MDNKIRLIEANLTKKAIKLLCENEKASISAITYVALMELIDKIPTVETESVKFTNWISVKDRLPDDEELYLICTESNFRKIDIAYYQSIGDKFSNYEPFWQGRSSRSTRVTHWMPLPELPKENDNDD